MIPASPFESREAGLRRVLTTRLLGMIAIGQSIGTGLFLGSGISVQLAGPAVILSYAVGALITLVVMWALLEMTVAHPMAGSFGAYAEHYLGPWAGWVTRYTYCTAQVIAVGSQIVAVAIYCRFWFPSVPSWFWILLFSAALLAVNVLGVRSFGEFEFWFSLFKVLAILLCIAFGVVLFAGLGVPRHPPSAYTAHGGFFPQGGLGVWAAVSMAIFSFYGLEVAAVSSGEASDPHVTVPRAVWSTLGGVTFLYIAGMAVLVGFVPWDQAGISESPFVKLYETMGVPRAAGVMNFVVLTAALSSINSNLYVTSRMLFSLARSRQAPRALGVLDPRGVPRNAVLAAGAGLAAAAVLYRVFSDTAFVYLLGTALFGGIFCWMMIFWTYFRFRRAGGAHHWPGRGSRLPWYPYSAVAGLLLLVGALVTMAFLPDLRIAWVAGIPWLAFISMVYWWTVSRSRPRK